MEKRILEFEDYAVDEEGNVFSYKCGRRMKLKPWVGSTGYSEVRLRKKGQPFQVFKVHRLVAKAFVSGETDVRCEVNHIDLNKTNNSASNLEWTSHAENMAHFHRSGVKLKMPSGEARRSSRKVVATCLQTGEKRVFHSAVVAEGSGFSRHSIYQVIAGKMKTHRGFSFALA